MSDFDPQNYYYSTVPPPPPEDCGGPEYPPCDMRASLKDRFMGYSSDRAGP